MTEPLAPAASLQSKEGFSKLYPLLSKKQKMLNRLTQFNILMVNSFGSLVWKCADSFFTYQVKNHRHQKPRRHPYHQKDLSP